MKGSITWIGWFLIGVAASVGIASANMASPLVPGDPLGEPSGDLKDMIIERETLSIDTRPLDGVRTENTPARAAVEAEYRFRNDGGARRLKLIFVANALNPQTQGPPKGSVEFDGKEIPFETGSEAKLPEPWKAPLQTPSLTRSAGLPYESNEVSTLGFTLDVPPGPHTLRVRYSAEPTTYSAGDPTLAWQLGYVLAPARRWGGFGKLDVTVHVPPGWRAEAAPALSRKGDVLTGSFDGIPADALGLTVQAPPPEAMPYPMIAWIGGLALCPLLGAWIGRSLGRRGRSVGWAVPAGMLLGIGWGIAAVLASVAQTEALKQAAGSQAARPYGYGAAFLAFGAIPCCFFLGLAFTQIAAVIAHRRARAARSLG